MDKKQIKEKEAYIFDMDGVLIDSEIENNQPIFEFVKSMKPEVEQETLFPIVGRGTRDSWDYIAKLLANGKDWSEVRREYFENWLPAHPNIIDYKRIFRSEVIDILLLLKQNNKKIGLASSTRQDKIEEILSTLEIKKYFDAIVSGETLPKTKPDPGVYLETAKRLGVVPKACMVMEDSTVGITAAHRAGMTVVALIDNRFNFDRRLADYEIKKIEDFCKFICV